MALEAGTRIGPYEIVAPLGSGGMGEVYRARDTKLKRDVALKVLPPAFSGDPERLTRFQREAEVLASLNHPNIAQIYGVEDRALVMELVEGTSPKGPMPFDAAQKVASQIAAALEYAHERGIIHRDLKPANVKITPDGVVKLLDFGLAKAFTAQASPSGNLENSPTLTLGATQLGGILGTAGYMAPEQARGDPVDKRADVWAFGVVLWEMLTGKRLFDGKTTSDVLAAVIRDEPDLNQAPGKVRPLLKRCLEKDPRRRLRDIGDAMGFIENTPEPTQATRPWAPWVVVAALFVAIAALAFIHFRESHDPPLITTSILPPESTSFDFSTGFDPPALSPDGLRMVFGARGAKRQLWVRSLDSTTAQPLAGTEGATFPFWSPDSRSVGFFAQGKLKRIDIAGGPPLTLANAPTPFGGTWSLDGVIVYCADVSGPLQRIRAGGGAPVPATTMGANHWAHRTPWFLPDGRHFLYSDQASAGLADVTIRIGSLDSKEMKTVGSASSAALYSSGYLLYLRQDTLIAQPFDERRLITTGDAMPVAEHVWSMLSFSQRLVGVFSVSREGLLAYQTGETNTEHQLTWFSRSGKRLETLGEPGDFRGLDLSPDGKTVATTRLSGNTDIWTYDVARRLASRFTFGAFGASGVWSADGHRIAFQAELHAHVDLYQKASDGTGNEELLYADEATKTPLSWAPDGRFLLFFRIDPALHTQRDIWLLRLEPASNSKAEPWLATPFNERFAKFSPDGHWVAYESDDSGRYEIYVAPFHGPGGKRQISTGGGTFPRWRRDGKEIFYVGADGTLVATQVSVKGVAVDVGETQSLHIPVITSAFYLYDVSADGQQFLVAAPREQQSAAPLTLVQNWKALLRKK